MKCILGLRRECIVFSRILENLREITNPEDYKSKEEELKRKFTNYEEWLKIYCSYCLKSHAEKRRKKMSGRFGIGLTI